MPDGPTIVEKTETITSKATGDAATAAPLPPPPAADDSIRGKLAAATIVIYGAFIVFVVWVLVFHSEKISAVESTLIGTMIGSMTSNVNAVYQYFYGSSSGSTAKDKRP